MKNKELSDYNEDALEGDFGVDDFVKKFHPDAKKTDGRLFDAFLGPFSFEIKTESRYIDETWRVAYERYSCLELKTSGGPWRALENGVDYFLSYFPKSKAIVYGEPAKITAYLEERLKNSDFTFKKANKRRGGGIYTTAGYAYSIPKLLEAGIVELRYLREKND